MLGVTVIVALTGEEVALVAVKDGIGPVPEAGSPIPALLLVQLNCVPLIGPLKFTPALIPPLHKVRFDIGSTVARGLTTIRNVWVGPLQVTLPTVTLGVTVIVADRGVAPLLAATNEGISPVPEPASPIEGVLLVHVNTVPGVLLVNVTADVLLPGQTICPLTGFMIGAVQSD